jgi:hypothetical protein
MKKSGLFFLSIFIVVFSFTGSAQKARGGNKSYFEIRVYHFTNGDQEKILDSFLQNVFIPDLHASGIRHAGVFKSIDNDTAADKRIYVLTPFKSLKHWNKHLERQQKSNPALHTTSSYTSAVNTAPAYTRMETIFLKAFDRMPAVTPSKLSGPKNSRVYELRSYESASEKLHVNKVHMFNEGGEVALFDRLGFNAVFYGSVIHGAKMPNLIYMTSFENMKERGEHWAAFGKDPAWKELSARPEYQKNVSKIEITFLRAAEYSDL